MKCAAERTCSGRGTSARTGICALREKARRCSTLRERMKSTRRRAAAGWGAAFKTQTVFGITMVPSASSPWSG